MITAPTASTDTGSVFPDLEKKKNRAMATKQLLLILSCCWTNLLLYVLLPSFALPTQAHKSSHPTGLCFYLTSDGLLLMPLSFFQPVWPVSLPEREWLMAGGGARPPDGRSGIDTGRRSSRSRISLRSVSRRSERPEGGGGSGRRTPSKLLG